MPATLTREHPKARQEILSRAGLSKASELTDAQVKRADSEKAKEMAEKRHSEKLRHHIMGKPARADGEAPAKEKKPVDPAVKKARDLAVRANKIMEQGKAGLPALPLGPTTAAKAEKALGKSPLDALGLSRASAKRWAADGEKPKDASGFTAVKKKIGDDRTLYGRKVAAVALALEEGGK